MLWKGFQRPKRLDLERDTLTDRFGRFYAQPFERGFGTTIGNALRRVLLSSIEGAAVTDVYNLVLSEVEAPLLETVMNYVKGNQTKASEMLGLNRGTLRKKLKQYDLL